MAIHYKHTSTISEVSCLYKSEHDILDYGTTLLRKTVLPVNMENSFILQGIGRQKYGENLEGLGSVSQASI